MGTGSPQCPSSSYQRSRPSSLRRPTFAVLVALITGIAAGSCSEAPTDPSDQDNAAQEPPVLASELLAEPISLASTPSSVTIAQLIDTHPEINGPIHSFIIPQVNSPREDSLYWGNYGDNAIFSYKTKFFPHSWETTDSVYTVEVVRWKFGRKNWLPACGPVTLYGNNINTLCNGFAADWVQRNRSACR